MLQAITNQDLFNRICMKFLLRMNSYLAYLLKREHSMDTSRVHSISAQHTSLTKVQIAMILPQSRYSRKYVYITGLHRYICTFKPGSTKVYLAVFQRVPAWTDRILYRSDRMKVIYVYISYLSITSPN